MVRAPDTFVYPAPTNIIEVFLVAPWELVLSPKAYTKLNRVVMSVLFCVPLAVIGLYESTLRAERGGWMRRWWSQADGVDDDAPEARDPKVDEGGKEISKVGFSELVKVFPNTSMVSFPCAYSVIS